MHEECKGGKVLVKTFSFVYIYTTTKPATWENFWKMGVKLHSAGHFWILETGRHTAEKG